MQFKPGKIALNHYFRTIMKIYTHTPTIMALVGLFMLLVGLLSALFLIPYIEHQLYKNEPIREGTKAMELFTNPPGRKKFKIYFLDVKNPEEVHMGEPAILKEKGPYVYDLHITKTILSIDQKSETIKYYLQKHFFFNQKDSGKLRETDMVTIVNVPLAYLYVKALEDSPEQAVQRLDLTFRDLFPGQDTIFKKAKVEDVLFKGIEVMCPLEDPTHCIQLVLMKRKHFRLIGLDTSRLWFSFFEHVNRSTNDDGPYEIKSGTEDQGQFVSYKGRDNLNYWKSDCDLINGTDFFLASPITIIPKKIYTYIQNFCRSIYFTFSSLKQVFGLPSAVYYLQRGQLTLDPEERCFCPRSKSKCLSEFLVVGNPKGTMEIQSCMNISLIVSFPHFYQGGDSLKNHLRGLNPQRELHKSFVSIEPKSGTPLVWKFRYQFNTKLKQIPSSVLLQNVTTDVFPIFWIEEEYTVTPERLEYLQRVSSFSKALLVIKYVVMSIGIVIMTVAPWLSFWCIPKKGETSIFPNVDKLMSVARAKSNCETIEVYPKLYSVEKTKLTKNIFKKND